MKLNGYLGVVIVQCTLSIFNGEHCRKRDYTAENRPKTRGRSAEQHHDDNNDEQHERTFVLCSESEEDELSLGIDIPEVQEEDILLFGDNLLKPLKRKKEKGKTKTKWTSTIQELKDFVQLVVKGDVTWRTRSCKGNASLIFSKKLDLTSV